jgi:PKD repeat protein
VYQQTNAVVLPAANFNVNYIPGCAPLVTNFINTSTNTVQWLWNFGDGTSSTLQNPSHTYSLPGNYTVSLIAFNSHGCSDTITFNSYIHVINTISNYIPPATINGCVPFNTSFSNTIAGAISWLWSFGDGATSTLQNPSHTYIASGFYTVALTVQLSGGCIQFYSNFRTFNIAEGQAGFTFVTPTLCAPYLVNFTGSLSGNLSSSAWDFGDGQTSSLPNPIHTYSNPGFYTVKYTTTTTQGCISTIIESNGMNFIDCSSTKGTNNGGNNSGSNGNGSNGGNTGNNSISPFISSCIPFTVQFNNTLPGTTSWLWGFGDGSTSIVQNPFHTYLTSGNYNVKLIVQKNDGTSDSVIYTNYIHALGINTDFSFIENGNCQNTTLTFTGTSSIATLWHWDFGDGYTSSLQNPVHTYSNSSDNYSILLTATNQQGCASTISKNTLVTSADPYISANSYVVCTNQNINFNCFPSSFTSYHWTFGDGTTSTFQQPVHSYLTGGSFQVTLTVADIKGCTHNDTLQNLIKVNDPVANFSYALVNGCNSTTVGFLNSSSGVSLPLSTYCKWSFGDASVEQWAENPTYTYATPGVYQVTLTVYHDNACFHTITKTVEVRPAIANFSFTQNATCFPITAMYTDSSSSSAISWLWDFGDGSTSVLQNPTHTFTTGVITDVTLTVTDANGCTVAITKPNIIFFYANFGATAIEGCVPIAIGFEDVSSADANQWMWNFGDGATSTLQNPTHMYSNSGMYSVTLIAISTNGCRDTIAFNSINISKPIANFVSANPTNCSPALVTFTDLSADATSWLWNFGDGSFSTNQNPGHVYNIPGVYTIKLVVTNYLGCSDSLIRINYIEVPGTIANFISSTNQSCIQSVVQFTDLSINASSWDWNFGDGNTSSQKNPSNSYQNSGQYTVSLIVHDSHGCSSSFNLPNPIIVNPLPTADFTAFNTVSCTPLPVSFQNFSQNAVSYLWNFGDGNTSTLFAPSHTYFNAGIYTVTVVATNQFGCTDTKMFNPIVAKKTPVINFTPSATKGCSPLTAVFTDETSNTQNATYFWNFGNGSTSTQQNPTAIFTTPGFYSISLQVTNNTGCSDTLMKPAFIEVYDLNPPAKSPILAVTVVTNTSTEIIWSQSNADDFSYYEIFRKDIFTGNYSSLGTINNSSVTSFVDDHNLYTPANSYCYKIQTVDICGYRLPLDSLQEHCTINVSAIGANRDINVKWTPYVGATVTTYDVYRMEPANTTPVLIATVPSSILTITDTTIACPFSYSYRIKANNLNGNAISSNSDTCIAKPGDNILFHQKVDVVRSTVIDNNEILTEWKVPLIAPERVTGYAIYKSTDNINFLFLNTTPSSIHEYIDDKVDVNVQNYYYKIKAVNSCDVQTEGNNSSSILLKAELQDGNVQLNWTEYNGWNSGVDYYIIEKMNENGEWKALKRMDGNVLNYSDEE